MEATALDLPFSAVDNPKSSQQQALDSATTRLVNFSQWAEKSGNLLILLVKNFCTSVRLHLLQIVENNVERTKEKNCEKVVLVLNIYCKENFLSRTFFHTPCAISATPEPELPTVVDDNQNCISSQDFSLDLETSTSSYLLDNTTWLIQVPSVFSVFPVSMNDFI